MNPRNRKINPCPAPVKGEEEVRLCPVCCSINEESHGMRADERQVLCERSTPRPRTRRLRRFWSPYADFRWALRVVGNRSGLDARLTLSVVGVCELAEIWLTCRRQSESTQNWGIREASRGALRKLPGRLSNDWAAHDSGFTSPQQTPSVESSRKRKFSPIRAEAGSQ